VGSGTESGITDSAGLPVRDKSQEQAVQVGGWGRSARKVGSVP